MSEAAGESSRAGRGVRNVGIRFSGAVLYPNRLPAVKNSSDLRGVFEGVLGQRRQVRCHGCFLSPRIDMDYR
ncbi:MAG: hypothetical protein ACK45A_11990, partial [Planctomyces sp.]